MTQAAPERGTHSGKPKLSLVADAVRVHTITLLNPNKVKGEVPRESRCLQCPWREEAKHWWHMLLQFCPWKWVMFQIWEQHQKHSHSVHVFLITPFVFPSHVPAVTIYARKAEAVSTWLHFPGAFTARSPQYHCQLVSCLRHSCSRDSSVAFFALTCQDTFRIVTNSVFPTFIRFITIRWDQKEGLGTRRWIWHGSHLSGNGIFRKADLLISQHRKMYKWLLWNRTSG